MKLLDERPSTVVSTVVKDGSPLVESELVSVAEVLMNHPITCLRQLEVIECSQEVRLEGTVPSYYLKQMAQEAVRSNLSGRRLNNRIQVLTAK